MRCLVYLIFDLCLFYESRCANPASADLVRMLGALLQFPFYSYPSHPFAPLGWLFIIFLFFVFLLGKKEAFNVVQASIICCSYRSLFSVLACPKYLHRSAPNMQISAPKCTLELIQASRDGGAV